MNLYLLFFVLPVVLAQECCWPEQFESYEGIYLGYTERNVPDFEPQTIDGIMRVIYDYTNQRQKILYLDVDFPGSENLEYILQDFAFNGTTSRFYEVYDDGSCFYQDVDAIMFPNCWDSIYPLLVETTFSSDIPAALYGSTLINDYVIVRQSDCLPLVSVATLINAPEEGGYQWVTTAFINTTLGISDPSEFDPPADCDPTQNPPKEVPIGFLHSWTNKAKTSKNLSKKP